MSGSSSDYQKILEEYEDKIIKFYMKSGKAKNVSDKFSMIYAYFYTRRQLTQKQLQELTSLSAGSISETVNQLLLMNMIEAHKQPGTKEKIYEIKGFGPEFVESASKMIEDYVKKYKKLIKKVQRRVIKINEKVSSLQDKMDFDDYYQLNAINQRILMFQAFIANFTLVYTTLKNAAYRIEEELKHVAFEKRD